MPYLQHLPRTIHFQDMLPAIPDDPIVLCSSYRNPILVKGAELNLPHAGAVDGC